LLFWITDFLCNRKQCVVLNGEKSTWFSVLSGIPQSSILGPLLFLIHINDLPELCAGEDPSSEIFLYGDDSKIYKVVWNQIDEQKLQSILNLYKNWSGEWLLRLNIDKCKSVSYCTKHSIDNSYHITDRNQLFHLEKVESMVDLGVRFDSNLTFRDHISEKINKAWVLLKGISFTWMNTLLHYSISQWYARMLNLQIRFGARIR